LVGGAVVLQWSLRDSTLPSVFLQATQFSPPAYPQYLTHLPTIVPLQAAVPLQSSGRADGVRLVSNPSRPLPSLPFGEDIEACQGVSPGAL